MPIVHLRSSTGMYGAEQVVLELCRHQSRQRGATRLIVFAPTGQPSPDLIGEALARGLRTEGLPCRRALDAHCVLELRRRLRAELTAGDVVLHCHDYKSVVYGVLATSGLPVTRVATLHGWLEGGGRLRLYHWLEARMLRHFKRVCAVSPMIAERLRAEGLRVEIIRHVNNGIDTSRYRPRPRPPTRRHGKLLRIGTAARLSPEKNLAMLIEAVGECLRRGLELQLEIVGDGPQREELQALIERLGLSDRAELAGIRAGLEDWYPELDAYVLPSLSEGMPMSILEALACGCPVIASRVGAIPELLEGISGCRVVPPGDFDALVNALLALPWTPGPLLEASDRISGRYSGTHMAMRYAGIYREAVSP